MSSKVQEFVTERLIALLEAGTVPWRKPWGAGSGQAINWKSRKPYRGVNCLLLDPGEYLTWNQIKDAGGTLRKGSKSRMVVFWKPVTYTRKASGEGEEDQNASGLVLRYYNVFSVADVDGIAPRGVARTHRPVEEAEAVLAGYKDGPAFAETAQDKAVYYPALDKVVVPRRSQFAAVEDFYSTAFHELVHSTGHPSRLARFSSGEHHAFGGESYSKEELVAEVGAAMLCAHTGILPPTEQQSAAYCAHWVARLRGDSRLIVSAAGQAQKAVDRILGTTPDHSEEE